MLDTTEGATVTQGLAISESRLLACDWRADMRRGKTPLTQRVGAAAASAGFEAILIRSAADPEGRNLAHLRRQAAPAAGWASGARGIAVS